MNRALRSRTARETLALQTAPLEGERPREPRLRASGRFMVPMHSGAATETGLPTDQPHDNESAALESRATFPRRPGSATAASQNLFAFVYPLH